MRFFEKYFGSDWNVKEVTGEAHVKCPFPHFYNDGTAYLEENASAHINTERGLFHCKNPGCESKKLGGPKGGLSEAGFMQAIQGITYGEASRLLSEMEEYAEATEQWNVWMDKLAESELMQVELEMLGIKGVEQELKLGYKGNGIVFPVFIFGEYMGACDYNPNPPEGQKKAILDRGMGQAIFPFDLWREDERDTYLMAGFKDAAIARKNGLNAVTFTHGEGSFPKLYKHSFKGKKVYICYDNDEGGREGAKRTATLLKEAGAYPIIVDLSLVCAEEGEDIHDFFIKYQNTSKDLEELASQFPIFTEEEYEKERNKIYPLVSLEESTSGRAVGHIVSSRVTIVADYSQTFRVPDVVEFEKLEIQDNNATMEPGERRYFYLDEKNIESVLKLVDSGLKESDIHKNLKQLAGINPGEKFVAIRERSWLNVHKAVVTDDFESEVLDENTLTGAYAPLEMTMYSLGDDNRMRNGEKYRIFYKAVNHPLKAREIYGVITKVEQSDSSVNVFKVNDKVLESLECFRVKEGETVSEKLEELFQRSKAILGPEANRPVFFATELFFHTPLDFMFDEKRKERAYLEPMIVGESRTHKSATAKGLLKLYELGTFASLKNASTAGLIGGSQSTGSGGFKTRLGVIPRNHKGAVILEEFSGAKSDFISSMTEIRSSNIVSIDRVNGRLTAPAKVRMLTLSNVKTGSEGTTLPLRQYPSGVKVLLELIGAAEDIARYDFFVLKDEGKTIDPNTPVETEAYSIESYKNRIRWIWSRRPEQVALTEQVRNYIVDCAKKLNEQYEGHIQFFGREAWKKLSRVAIAVAACVCSYDETGESLKVTEEHVVWARNWLVRCYDNEIFKLKQFVEEERSYSRCDTTDVQVLQGLFNRNPTLIHQMEVGTEYSQNQLQMLSGMEKDKFGDFLARLTEGKFVIVGEKIRPSPKFRTAMRHVQKTKMKRV